jgi:hypothetical protein
MTKRTIEHEVKLEKSVKIILAALAFGVLAHAFAPAFSINDAMAYGEPATKADVKRVINSCLDGARISSERIRTVC